MYKFLFISYIGMLLVCVQSEEDANPSLKIKGGSPARLEDAKFMVSIREKIEDYPFGAGHFCGGTLISPRTVLSAAHCFFIITEKYAIQRRPNDMRVVMGTINRYKKNYKTTLVFDVTMYIIHGYYKEASQYDVAVLSFNGKIEAHNPDVQPIKLTENVKKILKMCKIMGWGKTGFSEKYPQSDVLLVTDVQIRGIDNCKAVNPLIKDGVICAGFYSGGKDACQGDSGGPLVCDNEQTGIISWGLKCGKALYPGIYTDIMTYRSWINHAQMTLESYGRNNNNNLEINVFIQILAINFKILF